MIDFSTLKGLTIPEGNVTKIEDAQGNVLWSAAPKIKFVPIMDLGTTTSTTPNGMAQSQWSGTIPSNYKSCTHALINGEIYSLEFRAETNGAYVYSVPDFAGIGAINIQTVANVVHLMGMQIGTYTVQIGIIAGNDHATINLGFTLTRDEWSYVVVDGVKYSSNYAYVNGVYAPSLTVPVGSVIECGIVSEYCEEGDDSCDGYVTVNGSNVLTVYGGNAKTYNYTVIGNATIGVVTRDRTCDCGMDGHHVYAGHIQITET